VVNQKTDAQGNFTVSIGDMTAGKNSLQVKLLNVTDDIVAESDIIVFTYSAV